MNTEVDYRARHREAIVKGRQKYPNLVWPDPWVSAINPPIYVAGGMVQIVCATPGCGNHPSVSPEWRLALCWDCGAVYEHLDIPEELAEIERLLVLRPHLSARNWNWPMLDGSETVDVLRAQNQEQGDKV